MLARPLKHSRKANQNRAMLCGTLWEVLLGGVISTINKHEPDGSEQHAPRPSLFKGGSPFLCSAHPLQGFAARSQDRAGTGKNEAKKRSGRVRAC